MPPRKKTKTLQYEVEYQPVRFKFDMGVLVLEPEDTTVVSVDGKFATQKIPGLKLQRMGMLREHPFTDVYDPKNPKDYEMIERVKQHLKNNPRLADKPIGLEIVPMSAPVPPDSKWDEMSADNIKKLVELTGKNLIECVNYETSKENPREDVLEALEQLNDELSKKAANESDVKVAL